MQCECNSHSSKASFPFSCSMLHKPILILVKDVKPCQCSINFNNEGTLFDIKLLVRSGCGEYALCSFGTLTCCLRHKNVCSFSKLMKIINCS
jgi:hypothetical protein